MSTFIEFQNGLEARLPTKSGIERRYCGIEPPIGEATCIGLGGERKLAVIAISDGHTRTQIAREYRTKGYSCVECAVSDEWAMKSNLFLEHSGATLVTDDLELIWQVRLHELSEGTDMPIHALVQNNELFKEAQALHLGAVEIIQAEAPIIQTISDLLD